ncbi:MAG: dTDP-4-dehydrorhamnose reductase [Candidatus Methylomirabilales bacterium]
MVLTGAEGLLGSDLTEVLGRTHRVVPLSRKDLDVTGPAVTATLRPFQPDLIIHAAAYTDVDGCEQDPARAFRVNSEGTGQVARACRELGIPLVYFSTDYVFDGRTGTPYREEDAVNPLSVYGRSKWEGEEQIRRYLDACFIVRTAWLYGRKGRSFVRTLLTRAKTNPRLEVVHDQVGCPTWTADLAEAVACLIEKAPFGLYHLTNSGHCSWFEFAQAIVADAGLSGVTLTAISSQKLSRPAPRPGYSVLENRAWLKMFGVPLRSWRHALRAFLAQGELDG